MINLTEERLKIYVSQEAVSLLDKLGEFFQRHNIDGYIVGGFIRDGLIGRSNNDIDIAVSSHALAIASEVAEAFHAKMVLLDEANQVARVILPQNNSPWYLDFASLRGSIEQDLKLRDFTINAIAIRLNEARGNWAKVRVIDPCGGYSDLRRRIVRAVSDTSFQQDPPRLLRAFRFAATLDFAIDPATEALIQRDAKLIASVAGERLRDELCYILETSKAYQTLCQLNRLGLLDYLIPELTSTKGVTQPKEHFWDVFDHSLQTVACVELLLREREAGEQDKIVAQVPWSDKLAQYFAQEAGGGHSRRVLLKLAALLHDIAKPATKTVEPSGKVRFLGHAKDGVRMTTSILERLRFSNREIRMVQMMIEQHLRPGYLLTEEMPSRRAIYRYFRDTAEVGVDTLFLGLADHLAARGPTLDLDQWRKHAETTQYIISKWFEEQDTIVPPKLVDGNILMEKFGLSPGPQIGKLLEIVREAQAAGEIQTPEEAIELVKKHLERGQ